MPTTNTAESAIDPSLLDNLRATCRRMIEERHEKLGNGTGGLQDREELAVLYVQALTLGLDHVTLMLLSQVAISSIPASEIGERCDALANANAMHAWGRRQAGLV